MHYTRRLRSTAPSEDAAAGLPAAPRKRLLDQGIQPVRISAARLSERVADLARVKTKYQKILGGQE